jgi:hypothetical protein
VVGLNVADDPLDRRAPLEVAFDGVGDAALLAADIDPELVLGRGVVAAVALVGDDAADGCADLALDVGDDRFERVAIVGIARQRFAWAMNWPPAECLSVVASETLTPNSQGLCALPLPMHSTSGACRL